MISAREYDSPTTEFLRRQGSAKWESAGDSEIAASLAEMDFGTAPAVLSCLRHEAAAGKLGYLTEQLSDELGRSVARWQRLRYGWRIAPDDVHVVPDILKALQIAIDRFSLDGSAVIVPTPSFRPFNEVAQFLDRNVIEVPMLDVEGRYRLDLAGIAAAFDAGGQLLVLCNPHNPTGRVFSRDELVDLAEVVDKHSGRVFSDEAHAPIVYADSGPHVPYASASPAGASHTLTATSGSKAWNLAGMKCAAVILSNDADRQTWRSLSRLVQRGVSTPGVASTIAAFTDGAPWLEGILGYLDGNRQFLRKVLADVLPEVNYRPPEGTYLAWLDFRAYGLGDDLAAFFRSRAGVIVSDGSDFGSPGRGFVRLNFATPRPVLDELLHRLALAANRRSLEAEVGFHR